MPGFFATNTTSAPSLTSPEQPVMPPSVLLALVVYEHVPSTPSTVNIPPELKLEESFSFREVPSVWSPSARELVVPVTVTLSSGVPVHPLMPVNDVLVVPV